MLLLASIYGSMGKAEEVMSSLVRSLGADPSYPLAWRQLVRLDFAGRHVERMTRNFPKPVLWMIEREVKDPSEKDWDGVPKVSRPAWLAYIAAKIRWRQTEFSRRNPTATVYRYTFDEESGAIIEMLAVWRASRIGNPAAEDALLDHWVAASDAAALDAAIYTDLFLEEWRPDFTAWKRGNRGKLEEYFSKFVLPGDLAAR